MARPASEISGDLGSHANGIDQYLRRLERLFAEKRLAEPDLRRAYVGAFLSFYTKLERAIEDLFLGLVAGRLNASPPVKCLIEVKSDRVARSVVQGGRPYVDWLPYDQTVKRAEAFLSGGRPFKSLDSQAIKAFERARVLRNALAHGGPHSIKLFETKLTSGLSLPTQQLNPAGFLRGQHAVGQTRFNHMLADCLSSMRKLTG